MKPDAVDLLIEILEGKSDLGIDHMTIIVTGDVACGEFKYRFPQSDVEYKQPKPESWQFFEYRQLKIGDVVSFLCIREFTKKDKKNLYPVAILELTRDHLHAHYQSRKWNNRIEHPQTLVEFALMRISEDPVEYVIRQNRDLESSYFR